MCVAMMELLTPENAPCFATRSCESVRNPVVDFVEVQYAFAPNAKRQIR